MSDTLPTPAWTDAAATGELRPEDVIAIEVAGREIALYSVQGEVFATDNLCTHGHARLCEGYLLDHEIECPLHQGRFDIRTGAPTCEPVTEGVRSYPVKIEGGRVFVALPIEP